MKFNVFDAPKSTEKELTLRLINRGNGKIGLVAVDATGKTVDGGNLLDISKDGILLHSYVEEDLGLPLDDTFGKIVII